jgi:aspartate aminotransferase
MEAGSWIRRMFEEGVALKAEHGAVNVYDLSLGNPEIEPPAEFYRELKKLAEKPLPGMHRYMANAGYDATRAAVAAQLETETGIRLKAADVLMTCGAAGAMNVVFKALLNPGEEVILFAPYFMEYLNYIDNHGGVPKIIKTDGNFLPCLADLEKAINPRTRAVVINSPNNPSGVVYGEEVIRSIAAVLRAASKKHGKDIYLVSDEPYRKIIYDGLQYPSPLSYYNASIIATSHSKDLALPGERIGYIAMHPDCADHDELINGFVYSNRILGFVNAPALMQHLVAHLQNVSVSVDEYRRKRDFLYDNLVQMGYSLNRPQGAFYMFPRSPLDDDVAFVRELQQFLVLAVPGSGFGTPGYFRICYCIDDRTIEGSLEGFRKAADKFIK